MDIEAATDAATETLEEHIDSMTQFRQDFER
jgi:hypothetical protein